MPNKGPTHKTTKFKTSIIDLLPTHLAEELRSPHSNLIAQASSYNGPSTSGIKITQNQVKPVTLNLKIFKQGIASRRNYISLMLYGIEAVFTEKKNTDLECLGIFLQALTSVIGRNVLTEGQVLTSLARIGIKVKVTEINFEDKDDMDDLNDMSEVKAAYADLAVRDMSSPYVSMLAYCCTVILLMGKQLSDNSCGPWVKKRVSALTASMGGDIESGLILPFDLATATKIYRQMGLCVDIRAMTVKAIMGASKTPGMIGAACQSMLTVLAWSEMNHVRMVQMYIFNRYPELLTLRPLQGSHQGMLREAMSYLSSLPEDERPYAKLLYGPDETKKLHRDNFIVTIDAAYAVGSFLHSSMKNYQGRTTGESHDTIQDMVHSYLLRLHAASDKILGGAYIATTDDRILMRVAAGQELLGGGDGPGDLQEETEEPNFRD